MRVFRIIIGQASVGTAVSLTSLFLSIEGIFLIILLTISLEIIESILGYYLAKLYRHLTNHIPKGIPTSSS